MWYRLVDLSAGVRALFPPEATGLFVALTILGNPTLLTVALSVLYWVVDRRRAVATVVGNAFVAYAAVVALKAWFALPRPPEAVWLIATDGYGFPSGHATAAAVVYGGLAVELDAADDWPRAVAVGALAGSIALSRVVLGVHYVGDVLAGLALGAAVLVVARLLTGGDPTYSFGLGGVAALPALAVTGGGGTAFGILGACVGGVAGSRTVATLDDVDRRVQAGVLLAVGLPVVVGIQVLGGRLDAVPALGTLDDAVLVATVLALPSGLDRLGAFAQVESLLGTGE